MFSAAFISGLELHLVGHVQLLPKLDAHGGSSRCPKCQLSVLHMHGPKRAGVRRSPV
jgi:hypothetical protein